MLHAYLILKTPLTVFINIFQITDATRVCSAHFQPSEITLTWKRMLSVTAVPSLFAWTKDSPAKRIGPQRRPLMYVLIRIYLNVIHAY